MICRACWSALRIRNATQRIVPFALGRHISNLNSQSQLLDSRLLKFYLAIQTGSPLQIKASYKQLRSHLSVGEPTEIDEDAFTKAMHIMSKSTVKDEINTAFVMFSDLVSLFGRKPRKEHRLATLQATLSRGWMAQARARLQEQPSESEEYALVMSAFKKCGQDDAAVEVFLESIQAGINPNATMYTTLLKCSEKLNEPAVLQKLTESMQTYLSSKSGLSAFNDTFWNVLFPPASQEEPSEPVIGQGDLPSPGSRVEVPRRKASNPSKRPLSTPVDDIDTDFNLQQLKKTLQCRGFEAALIFLEGQRKHSSKIPLRLVSTLSSGATKSAELRQLSSRLGIAVEADSWASLISKTVNTKGLPAALAVYKEAKEHGIKPLCILAEPLLTGFSEHRIRSSNDSRLQDALQVYQEVIKSMTDPSKEGMRMKQRFEAIFDSLLRMFANTADPAGTFPLAVNLLNDMGIYGITFDLSTATTMVILLMRSSPSHDAAYEVCTIFQEQYGDILDAKSCDAILGAFSQLSFPHQLFTPPSLFFMMLNNLQRSGFQLSKRAYTTILSHIARTCAHTNRHSLAVETVRQIHKRLLLDASLSPDTVLLNSLMNAYNRAGSTLEAIRVWETLYLQGKHNNTSLSIVLDALSHSGALQQAAAVMARLHKLGFKFDRNNWQSWLELLCRAEKFEEALRLLTSDMQRTDPPMTPDHEHICTLLKYSWNSGRRREIQSRCRRNWPSIWTTLPEELKA